MLFFLAPAHIIPFFLLLFVYTIVLFLIFLFFFFNDTATTEIYTLSLHDALPISARKHVMNSGFNRSQSAAYALLFFCGSSGRPAAQFCRNSKASDHHYGSFSDEIGRAHV